MMPPNFACYLSRKCDRGSIHSSAPRGSANLTDATAPVHTLPTVGESMVDTTRTSDTLLLPAAKLDLTCFNFSRDQGEISFYDSHCRLEDEATRTTTLAKIELKTALSRSALTMNRTPSQSRERGANFDSDNESGRHKRKRYSQNERVEDWMQKMFVESTTRFLARAKAIRADAGARAIARARKRRRRRIETNVMQ